MIEVKEAKFTKEQCRKAVLGFCGANENALLHYLAFSAAIENEAAIISGQAPANSTTEHLVEFQLAIMEWLDSESPDAPPISLLDPTSCINYDEQEQRAYQAGSNDARKQIDEQHAQQDREIRESYRQLTDPSDYQDQIGREP